MTRGRLETDSEPPTRRRPAGNEFGLVEAVVGLLVGWVLSSLGVALFSKATGHHEVTNGFGANVVNLVGLWLGLVGAALYAGRYRSSSVDGWRSRLRSDYGFAIRLVDLPVGVAVGVAAQYLLTPLLELPLVPFVPHLSSRLNQPAKALTHGVGGVGLVVLGVLVCVGSPVVEELYFRGLLLRGLLGRLGPLGPRLGPVLAVVATGVIFGLVHFEPLELIALAGFGVVLGVLAVRSGRLGPGIIAHMAFNTTTFVALALRH